MLLLAGRKWKMFRVRSNIVYRLLRKLWIFAVINELFVPVTLYGAYLLVGPWFAGNLIDDGHVGVVFAWITVFLDGTTLPGTFSYFYGFMNVLLFNSWLILLLGHTADMRYIRHVLLAYAPRN